MRLAAGALEECVLVALRKAHKVRCTYRFQATALAYGMTIPRSSAEVIRLDTMYIMLNNSIANIEKIKRLVEIQAGEVILLTFAKLNLLTL